MADSLHRLHFISHVTKRTAVRAFFSLLALCALANASLAAEVELLGSANFTPTPTRPIGWRGDGTGRYPGATPPLNWERKREGTNYTTQNILWLAPLPNTGVSMPIIVGDRVFVTAETCDLICLDKHSGKLAWIRSSFEFEGLSEDERKAIPSVATTLVPLAEQIAKVNDELVAVLNERVGPGTADAFTPAVKKALEQKRALEKKLHAEQLAIDKKGYDRYWGQAVFGFAGPTPISDGRRVCVFFTTGVSAAFDFEGRRQWLARGTGGGSEHGNFASPLLWENQFVVWANELRSYDAETGKLRWTAPAKGYNTYGSMFRLRSGDDWVAAFQWGFFVRFRDGKPVWEQGVFGDSVQTPIVEGDMIFARVGYPKYNEEAKGFRAFKIPASTESGNFTAAYTFKQEWGADELVVDKKKNPFDRGFVSSPLFVDGLIYQLTQAGGLLVNDAATGELVYRKVLTLAARTQYWNWAGASMSPALAGKHIYLMDNQGHTIVLKPGLEYREVARNTLEEFNGKELVQTVSTPIFEGARMYFRTPGYLYCIGK